MFYCVRRDFLLIIPFTRNILHINMDLGFMKKIFYSFFVILESPSASVVRERPSTSTGLPISLGVCRRRAQ